MRRRDGRDSCDIADEPCIYSDETKILSPNAAAIGPMIHWQPKA
jgi:hypothetical protein